MTVTLRYTRYHTKQSTMLDGLAKHLPNGWLCSHPNRHGRQNDVRRTISAVKTKPSKTQPYAAIEHRVIDSEAFAALTPNAKVILLLMARQLTKDNNGHLQATFSFMQRHGIGSEHTLQNGIKQLISHGFIYRTKSHGANGVWARYAVTWLPIKRSEGLFLDSFRPCAWRDWKSEKKPPCTKCRTLPADNAVYVSNFLQ